MDTSLDNIAPVQDKPELHRGMVAAALRRIGFQVTLRTNVNRVQMRAAVRDFGEALRRGQVGLFYYAGHGVESKGKNFLIPLAANMATEFELEDEAVDANSVLRAMEDAGNPTNIMILDACRDNPFARSWRSASRGLAQMNAPTGSFIAFATAPGSVASDGTGRNAVHANAPRRHFLRDALHHQHHADPCAAVRHVGGGRARRRAADDVQFLPLPHAGFRHADHRPAADSAGA